MANAGGNKTHQLPCMISKCKRRPVYICGIRQVILVGQRVSYKLQSKVHQGATEFSRNNKWAFNRGASCAWLNQSPCWGSIPAFMQRQTGHWSNLTVAWCCQSTEENWEMPSWLIVDRNTRSMAKYYVQKTTLFFCHQVDHLAGELLRQVGGEANDANADVWSAQVAQINGQSWWHTINQSMETGRKERCRGHLEPQVNCLPSLSVIIVDSE